MRKILLLISLFTVSATAFAQAPEDIMRYSYLPQHGSARSMAVGGAMGSLGGDINALFVNPAGLGLYKTSEFVISPGFFSSSAPGTYRGTTSTGQKKSAFDLGTSGFVGSFNTPGSKLASQVLSIGINQTANFNNTITYKGLNNYSSYTEQFTEEISNSGHSLNGILNDPRYAFGSAQAVYTYLVDTFRTNGSDLALKGLPEFLLANGTALNQEKTVETKGGIYEIAVGYAANSQDKLYWGVSLGIPIVSYERDIYYRESDASGNTNNNFNYFTLRDRLTTSGVGLNAKIGLLYRPVMHWRFGFTLHSPTLYSLTDKESSNLTADTEGYNGVATANSGMFTGGVGGQTKYGANTPWKTILSASYVFNEVSDTRKQKAFITADVEYLAYRGGKFTPNTSDESSTPSADDQAYYDNLKAVIKSYYTNAFNFRLGGEIKFNTFMVRAGGAYYSNPYKDRELKSNIMQASGGIGYRDHGIFIDLTYVYTFSKDVDFPYRLSDKSNTFAELKNTRSNVMLTFGIKI